MIHAIGRLDALAGRILPDGVTLALDATPEARGGACGTTRWT